MPGSKDLTTILKDPVVQDVYQYLSKNPNPDDAAFHTWAESAGHQPDDAESASYTLATKLVQFLNEGKAKEKQMQPADTKPSELSLGKTIEQEHTSDEGLRARIATDHLAEDPEYYSKPEHIDFKEEAKKQAQHIIPAWGGGEVSLAPRGFGPSLNAGYTNLLGLVPIPTAGIELGGPHYGLGIQGPIPGISFRAGPRLPGATGWTRHFPRGLIDLAVDKAHGRTKEEVYTEAILKTMQRMKDKGMLEKEAPKRKKEEAKKQAMHTACYLVGMKRAYDERGIKFAAGGGSGGVGLEPWGRANIMRTRGSLLNSSGTVATLTNNGQPAPNIGQRLHSKWNTAPQGKPQAATMPKQAPTVRQPEAPPKAMPSAPPVNNQQYSQNPGANSPNTQPMTVTACWNKFSQLATGGGESGGSAPMYNAIDQRPVTLATPEPASLPSRPAVQQGNSLYDMFATRFPDAVDTEADDGAVDEATDPQGYAARQPEGLTHVMNTQMGPQVGV